MTSVVFTNARLINPETGTDSLGWLHAENGRIAAIGDGDAPAINGDVIDCNGKCLAPGIVDIGVKVCEPGERHKESYKSAGLAAAAGGVGALIVSTLAYKNLDLPPQPAYGGGNR